MRKLADLFPIALILRPVLKYPLTILLMLIIGLQTFSRWLVLLDFECNRTYIAANLCVNRQMPGSCCKGKCYLKKQLTKDDDQQQPANSNQKDEVTFFAEEPLLWNWLFPASTEKRTRPYLSGKSQEYFISVFQPPQA
jgi:hypothetical protein